MVNRCGRASQCPAEPAAATSVIASATSASLERRAMRNSNAKVSARTRLLANTTAAMPACRCSQPNSTSHSHSQANHGCPERVKEKISLLGTRPCARIHSPVRRCQPVSPSPNSVCAPFIPQNRNTRGITNAASVMDGSHRREREGLDECMRAGKPWARAGPKKRRADAKYLVRFQFAQRNRRARPRSRCTNRRRVSGIETRSGRYSDSTNRTRRSGGRWVKYRLNARYEFVCPNGAPVRSVPEHAAEYFAVRDGCRTGRVRRHSESSARPDFAAGDFGGAAP
jgi:hypothetical protein